MIRYSHLSQGVLLATALVSSALLTGCADSLSTSPVPSTSEVATLQGRVHGGQQPVSGATIQLYKANTTSFLASSAALIPTTVLTKADGSFNITGTYSTYTCQPGDYLYITATGGNPGVAGTQNNSALALMAGLGPCAGVTSSTDISINELTTVASVWALASFMRSPTVVATNPTNVTGLALAFAAINKLVNTQTGTMPGPALPAGATIPTFELNTLADILGTCINTVDTTSPAAQSASCQALFTAVGYSAGTTSDTITAALALAHNPGKATSLYASVSSSAPFQPKLGAAPTDWTVAINYIGGGLNSPSAIALDQSGNVWVANNGNNSVTKLDNTGAAISGASGFTAGGINAPTAIAIDLNGTPWISNTTSGTVTHLSASGATGSAYGLGLLSSPMGIAIDAVGNVWIANYGNSTITELNGDGTLTSLTGISAGGINKPTAIAINPQ